MSNLFKSKFLLGVMIVATMFVGVAAIPATTEAASCSTFTMTLRYGMRNSQVLCLQQMLNQKGYHVDGVGAGSAGLETNFFGPATRTTVKSFQTANGLTSDGIFGPMSRASLVAQGNVSGNFPAGCASASGYSATTGLACYAIPPVQTGLPAGCTTTAGFSPTTGVACSTTPSVTYPAGCSSAAGFSSTTGASCATGVVTNTGPITVALATDNPASGSFIAPASGVQFAKFTFSGTGTVTSVKLQRTGVSSSTTVSNVYLYDGATRLTDGASINSDNTVTFNAPAGLFTVAGSKTITVVATTVTADYSLGFTLIGYTANGTASVVSVAGNQMFGASATLAKATLSAATASGDTDAGADVTVWQSTATIDTRDVLLKSLALRNVGTIASADINNFKLYVDGVLVQTVASLDANGYVTFSTPVTLKTGARTLKVTADVVGGSGRTVLMSLRGAYDLMTTDTQYNASGTTVFTAGFPNSPTVFTVNSGSITVVKATNSPSTNVTIGASDVNLATYTFTAYGEPIKVETLKVGMVTTGGTAADNTLRNVRILVGTNSTNMAQVGSNTSVPAAAVGVFTSNTGTLFTTNFVVTPGTPTIVEIHSDIVDNEVTDDIAATTTTAVQVALIGGTSAANATRQVSLGTINVPSTTSAGGVLGNSLTISSGSMTIAKTLSYASRTTSVPATAYKIGSFTLTGNSTEAINLNTIYVGWTTASTVKEPTELSDLYVVYGGTMTPVKGTVVGSDVSATASLNGNSWSINKTLAKNETMQFDVYATIAGTLTGSGVINPTLAVAGTTASSGIAVYADSVADTVLDAGVTGQTVTGGNGSFTVSADASTSVAQLVDDSGAFKSLSAKFVAVTDSYTITSLNVTLASGGAGAVSTVRLMSGGLEVGTPKAAAASMTWSGLSIPVAAGQTKIIDVELTLSSVGVDAGTSASSLATAIVGSASLATSGSASTSAAITGTGSGTTSYVYKAVPTVTFVDLTDKLLTAGTKTIAKFTVNTNGTGSITWKQAMFEISMSGATGPALSAFAIYDVTGGANNIVTAAETIQNATGGTGATDCDTNDTSCELLILVGATIDDNVEETVNGSKTYEIRATVGGSIAAGDYVTTSIQTYLGHVVNDTATVNANDTSTDDTAFLWSDMSTVSHDTGTADWTKDNLLKTLPTSTWTLLPPS